jgi:KDO2-lipid IV(A) lauroyltransferase
MEDKQKGIPTLTAFIADQTPRINDIQYWTTFLNQDTAVVVGLEKIARKLNAVVIAAHPKKIKRGYYEVEYFLVTDNPKETAKFEITEQCTRFLEKIIIKKPEYWLWSHKRWKHKRIN